jgi:hypothetical protein
VAENEELKTHKKIHTDEAKEKNIVEDGRAEGGTEEVLGGAALQ